MTKSKIEDERARISDWLERLPAELPVDAIGLWQIVPAGQTEFALTDERLTAFVASAIRRLLASGAVPVRHVPGSDYDWTEQAQYGSTIEEKVAALVAEWTTMPDDPQVLCGEGVWFARDRPGTRHVQRHSATMR
jgi:hypothetical protein